MNCRQVEKRLPLYVSGDIGGRRGRRIGLHLEACPHCRAAFDLYSGERCRLRAVRDEDRSRELTGFYEELAARLSADRRAQAARMGERDRTPRVGTQRLAWGLASLFAVCAVVVWAWEAQNRTPERTEGIGGGPGDVVIAEPDGVQPFRLVATQGAAGGGAAGATMSSAVESGETPESRARLRPLVIPAAYQPSTVVIFAGPRAAVPIVAPPLPAEPPIPRVQPYACPSSFSGPTDRRVH